MSGPTPPPLPVELEALLRRMPGMQLATQQVTWRENLGLRGLTALPVTF